MRFSRVWNRRWKETAMNVRKGVSGMAGEKLTRNLGCGVFATVGVVIVGVIVGVVMLAEGIVNDGYVGIRKTLGRVDSEVLEPGWHLHFPLTQDIIFVEVRVRPHQFEEIEAASK